jgi:hypothetical protein
MASLDKNTGDEEISFDAKQVSEDIAKGEQKKPKVNVESDYERSKEFAVAEIDKTEEGSKAAQSATAPAFKVPEADAADSKAIESDADPASFLDMAREVNPQS